MMGHSGKLVVVGVAGLDWRTLQGMIDAGGLPALAKLIEQGTSGSLTSITPASQIATWGTIATGTWPEDHGLVLPDEPWVGGLRAAGADSWQKNPVWQRLSSAGIATASVNWPATAPGQGWAGIHVDDRFPISDGWTWADWPLPRGVCPELWREQLRDLRVHVSDVSGSLLAGLVPEYETIDQSRDHRLLAIARHLAELATTHAAAKEIIASEDWQALFIRYDFLARARDSLGGAAAPYHKVEEGAWSLLDATVAEILGYGGGQHTCLLLSPGYKGAVGSFIVAGPKVTSGKRLGGATTLDIAPTVYAFFGFGDPQLAGRLLAGPSERLRTLPRMQAPASMAEPDPADLARIESAGLAPPSVPRTQYRFRQLQVLAQLVAAREPHRASSLAREAEELGDSTILTLGLQAVSHFAAGEAEALLGVADRMSRIDPEHVWSDLARAAYHALRDDLELAKPLLDRVEQKGGPDEHVRAAAAYLMLGELRAAQRLFRSATDQLPDSVGVLLGLASTSASDAERDMLLKRVLALSPTNKSAREALSYARLAVPPADK